MIGLERQIEGYGPSDEILVLGECPEPEDVKSGVAFTGFFGQIIRRKLSQAGFNPENVRYEYVVERIVYKNNFNSLYEDSRKFRPRDELREWHRDCIDRINKCRPKLVIAVGDTALRAITYPQHWPIEKSHCYVLKNTKLGNTIPVIPIFSPRYINYDPSYGVWLGVGCSKAMDLLCKKDHIINESNYVTLPNYETVIGFLKAIKGEKEISIDIESEKNKDWCPITAIGFASNERHAICIPWGCWTEEQDKEIRSLIGELLSSSCTKIFQNFIFDCMMLTYEGFNIEGPIVDTMELSVILNPQLKKSLGDLGRIYLCVEPWKHKDSWKTKGLTDREFALYNCRDVAYTWKIKQNMWSELVLEGFVEYYSKYREPLYIKILKLCNRGWRIDIKALNKLAKDLTESLDPIINELTELATPWFGEGVKSKKVRDCENDKATGIVVKSEDWKTYSEKDLYLRDRKTGELFEKAYKKIDCLVARKFKPSSTKHVQDVLKAKGIKLPSNQKKLEDGTREARDTTDDKALVKLARKYPDDRFISLMREFRGKSKMLNTYASVKLDPDNRMRFQINISGADTGRFSSSQSPKKTGLNSQNFPGEFRHVVIPEDGHKFIQLDLKQAELWMVAWLSDETTLLSKLKNNEDVHQLMADIINKELGIEVGRDVGKTTNHATSYLMGPQKFADKILVECNFAITFNQAKRIIQLRYDTFPKIPKWQKDIENNLKVDRSIVTPFGRKQTFYGRLDHDLVAKALNFVPQSTVADIINTGWLKLDEDLSRVIQQGHDSLLLEVKEDRISESVANISNVFNNLKFKVGKHDCLIPYELQIGENWGKMNKIKVGEYGFQGK